MTVKRQLILIIVAYHPSQDEVNVLQSSLQLLPSSIGYAIIANDYIQGEPVDDLHSKADVFITSKINLGYARAINKLVSEFEDLPPYLAILNTDVRWCYDIFTPMVEWLNFHTDVKLMVPQILDSTGTTQFLCKRHPTILGMFSRRFIHKSFKPRWMLRYDQWYTMQNSDYSRIFDVEYLSGCCMVVSSKAFMCVGGFDEKYFLYLEDADFTRSISRIGRCIHYPYVSIVHNWGRGNYYSLKLMLVNLSSALKYFTKWGFALW